MISILDNGKFVSPLFHCLKIITNHHTLMKINPKIPILLVSLGLSASASAAVALIGVDSTAGANWRTAANFEADNEYGTSGYVVFGLNEADSVYTQPFDVSDANTANAYNLPAGITVTTADTNIGMWSGNGWRILETEIPSRLPRSLQTQLDQDSSPFHEPLIVTTE
jgi:hypothetical protein